MDGHPVESLSIVEDPGEPFHATFISQGQEAFLQGHVLAFAHCPDLLPRKLIRRAMAINRRETRNGVRYDVQWRLPDRS